MSDPESSGDRAVVSGATVRLPDSLAGWLMVFGPGAIVASLTIGTGELIFSTRGGAIFGYRILFVFLLISLLKWGLVMASARHIVLTGVHPYERMLSLPGPRGWLPCTLFLIAAICMPVWVSFHSGVLGNMASWLTGTSGRLGGAVDYLWGALFLAGVLTLSATSGYDVLERVQIVIVLTMVFCAGMTLVLYRPDWLGLLAGAVIPPSLEYPDWLPKAYPEIARHSPWVETTRYVGVIGGAGFDYMVYTTFLREKNWGRAGLGPVTAAELSAIAEDPGHSVRRWVLAPAIDLTISFALVVGFSAVFVASGTMILGPQHRIPGEENMLGMQAEFVMGIHPWLLPLYVIGALLTMVGTLYGTLEVACSIALEMFHSADHRFAMQHKTKIRRAVIAWCAVWAAAVLVWLFVYQSSGAAGRPRQLLALLTPINLFTGVLGCGIFCWLLVWMDRRFLPPALRMPAALLVLNSISGVIFLGLGLKGTWDAESRLVSLCGLAVLLAAGWLAAIVIDSRLRRRSAGG